MDTLDIVLRHVLRRLVREGHILSASTSHVEFVRAPQCYDLSAVVVLHPTHPSGWVALAMRTVWTSPTYLNRVLYDAFLHMINQRKETPCL